MKYSYTVTLVIVKGHGAGQFAKHTAGDIERAFQKARSLLVPDVNKLGVEEASPYFQSWGALTAASDKLKSDPKVDFAAAPDEHGYTVVLIERRRS